MRTEDPSGTTTGSSAFERFREPDDYASMREVLTRRFSHGLAEREEISAEGGQLEMGSFTRFPDLIMMDGGRGQVNIALEVLQSFRYQFRSAEW